MGFNTVLRAAFGLMLLLAALLQMGASAAAADEDSKRLTLALQPGKKSPQRLRAAERLAARLGEQLGVEASVRVPADAQEALEALSFGQITAAWFEAPLCLAAREIAGAELVAAKVFSNGETSGASVWLALRDGGIASLADARGKAAAFVARGSASGYLLPMARLIREGLMEQGGGPEDFFARRLFAGSPEKALRALLDGRADVAAVDAGAPERCLSPQERERLAVLASQGPIPAPALMIHPDLPADFKKRLGDAFLELNQPEHRPLLRAALGASEIRAVDAREHFRPLEEALALLAPSALAGEAAESAGESNPVAG
jgi:phosphonate transport system substrate-binding protein